MEKEIWKDIVGYEELYQVSSFGNIRNIKTDRILKSKHNVCLSKNGFRKTFNINELVSLYFIGFIRKKYKVIFDNMVSDINGELSNKSSVCYSKQLKKWRVLIVVNEKIKYLGYFKDGFEAQEVYNYKLNQLSC